MIYFCQMCLKIYVQTTPLSLNTSAEIKEDGNDAVDDIQEDVVDGEGR